MGIKLPKIDPAVVKAKAEQGYSHYMALAQYAQKKGNLSLFDYYSQHADHCLRMSHNPFDYVSLFYSKPTSTVKKIVNDPDFATPPTWAANQRLPVTRKAPSRQVPAEPVPLTNGTRRRILQEFQQKWQKAGETCPHLETPDSGETDQ